MANITAYHYRDGAEQECLQDIHTAINLGYSPIMLTFSWENAEKKAQMATKTAQNIRIYHAQRIHAVLIRQ